MTKQSKVKSVTFDRSYESTYGTFFLHKIEFENNDSGEYTSKSKDQSKFVIGETVSYEIDAMKDPKGNAFNKISPVKENTGFTPSAPGAKTPFKQYDGTGAMVGASINNAVSLICYDKIKIEQLEATAERICEISLRLKAKFEGK
jgi:hypothetical protein